ncbi:MAG: cysteine synthase family protein [Thermomicrobiales bacterium]|nr:cysteine synthase family protein [Thermomicrobiales bacterium]
MAGSDPAVVQAIGNTPLLGLSRFAERIGLPPSIELWLKAEWANPGGSVKDRPALAIVRQGLASGQLGNGRTLLDATSGNTGIAYAMLGAAFGFPVELVIPESASSERKAMLTAYGATIVYSDPYEGSNGAILMARELAASKPNDYFYADQYSNKANPRAHYEATGPEVWEQTSGRITHFVAGLGTSGTLMGTGRFLREQKPRISLVAAQPAEAFHGIEGLKHMPTAIVPSIYDDRLPDIQIGVDTEDAYAFARELARVEGIFAGVSAGAALAAAVRMARECADRGEPAAIVFVAPDDGGKYLSTELWS